MTAQVKHQYKSADGKRLPSVTTICSRFKESGGLLHWANAQGLAGKTLDEARQEATAPGSLAHKMVEADLHGEKFEPGGDPVDIAKAKSAFASYETWRKHSNLEFRHTEVSLASAVHKFGGTLDAIGIMGNQLCLVDWKNANAVYPDNLYQLAAYAILWEENYPDHKLVGGFHLCRFSKENGDFSHHFYDGLEEEKITFLKFRELYDRVKLTEKRVR